MRRFLAGAVCLALLALVVSPLASDARKKKPSPRLAVATYDGPEVSLAPMTVTDANYVVKCPRGWQTTGFGVLNGANDVVFADPTSDGRGYVFAFGNPSPTGTYGSSGSVRCEKGGKGLKVRKAAARGSRRKAVRDWLKTH